MGALINLELEEKNARLDWKTLLQDFLALDEKDYSFTPPDKRYDSSPFFLPDFNLEEMKIKGQLALKVQEMEGEKQLDAMKMALGQTAPGLTDLRGTQL